MEKTEVSPGLKILAIVVQLILIVAFLAMVSGVVSLAQGMLHEMGVNESFFACLGIFLVTFFLVNTLATRPTSRMLVERDKRMDGREKEIHQISNELYEANKALEAERKLAQKEASERFSQIKAQAVEEQRRTLQEARDKAASEIKKLKDKLQDDFNKEVSQLDKQTEALSSQLFDSLLKSAKAGGKGAQTNLRTGA